MARKRKIRKEEIKAYARELYMVPGKRGKPKNSSQDIADEILLKFGKHFTRQTIGNWTREIDEHGTSWQSQYLTSVAAGIKQAHTDQNTAEDGKTAGETLDDIIAGDVKEQYQKTKQVHNLQSYIFGSFYASTAGTIRKYANEHYNGDVRKILADELVAIIPPVLMKIIASSEKEMNSRLQEMRSIASSGRTAHTENIQERIANMTDDELTRGLGDKWKT